MNLNATARHDPHDGGYDKLLIPNLTHISLQPSSQALIYGLVGSSRATLTTLNLTDWSIWPTQVSYIWSLPLPFAYITLDTLRVGVTADHHDEFNVCFLSKLAETSHLVQFEILSVECPFSVHGVKILQALGNHRNLKTVRLGFLERFFDADEVLLRKGFEKWEPRRAVKVTIEADEFMCETQDDWKEMTEGLFEDFVEEVGERGIRLKICPASLSRYVISSSHLHFRQTMSELLISS